MLFLWGQVNHVKSQPVLTEAISVASLPLPKHLQGISSLSKPLLDKHGRLFTFNDRYIIFLNAPQPQAFAGQGLRGLPRGVAGLTRSKDGTLWAIDDTRYYHFDEQKQLFVPHTAIINGDTILPHRWLSVCWNRYMLISAGNGKFYCMDTSHKKPFLKAVLSAQEGRTYRVFQIDYDNAMLTTGKSWYLLQPNGTLKRILTFSTTEEAQTITYLPGGWLYVWTKGGTLFVIHLKTLQYRKYAMGESVVRPLGNFSFNGKYYATLGGADSLYLFHPSDEKYTTWKITSRQPGYKMQPWYGIVFQEPGGRVWINNNKGLAYFQTQQRITHPWLLYQNKLDSLEPGRILEPKLIKASRFHPYVLFTASNKLHITDTSGKNIFQTAILPGREGLSFTQLSEMDEDRWLIGAKQGLFVFRLSTNTFREVTYSGKSLSNVQFAVFGDSIAAKDRDDNMLLAALSNTEKWIAAKNAPADIEYLEQYNDKVIVSSGAGGLHKRDSKGNWISVYPKHNLTPGQWSGSALGIHEQTGTIVHYSEGSLRLFDVASCRLKKVLTLTNPEVSYNADRIIAIDTSHIGLLYKNAPLTIININTGAYYNLGMQQGWWGEFLGAQSDISKGISNDWWATFDAGIIRYPTQWLLTPPDKPEPPLISNIYLQYQPHPYPAMFYRNNPLEVSYKQGAISLEMNGYPRDSIEYCLLPFDATWRKGTVASFTNLQGGTYIFKARIAGSNNASSPENILKIKILPPFWKTLWFKMVASFSIALLAYFLFRWRLNAQAIKQKRALELAQSELKAIRSQMNPHFIFNCITAIDGLISTKQNQKASEYLGKFSRMVRQVLHLSEKQFISLRDELDTLKLYLQLEQLRMQDGFTYAIHADNALLDSIEIPPLLLQPFAENAIIHGFKSGTKTNRHIEIRATQSGNNIQFVVRDNGSGRAQAALVQNEPRHHVSMGTRLTNERLHMMEKVLGISTHMLFNDLYDESGNAAGTEVIINIHKSE